LAELAGLSKGYVYRLTPTGTKVLREIADVDWMDSAREIVVFMRGPKPARRNNLEELLAEMNPEANLPQAEVVERVVLGKGMGAYVGDEPPHGPGGGGR